MLATITGVYLILGLPAALLVWMMLIGSKKDENRGIKPEYNRSKYTRFHEHNTEPRTLHS